MYCHWDGYIKNNGVILLDNYKTQAQVEKLVSLGSISSLRNTFEETKKTRHNDFNSVTEYSTLLSFAQKAVTEHSECEYFYLFTGGEWLVFSRHFPHVEGDKNFMAQGYELEKILNK